MHSLRQFFRIGGSRIPFGNRGPACQPADTVIPPSLLARLEIHCTVSLLRPTRRRRSRLVPATTSHLLHLQPATTAAKRPSASPLPSPSSRAAGAQASSSTPRSRTHACALDDGSNNAAGNPLPTSALLIMNRFIRNYLQQTG